MRSRLPGHAAFNLWFYQDKSAVLQQFPRTKRKSSPNACSPSISAFNWRVKRFFHFFCKAGGCPLRGTSACSVSLFMTIECSQSVHSIVYNKDAWGRLLLAVFFCFSFLVQFFVDVLVQNRVLFGKFFIGYIFVSGFFQQLVILFGFLFCCCSFCS